MKKELDENQSMRLVELGVPKGRATVSVMLTSVDNGCEQRYCMPIFTYTDVMELLPKEIKVKVTDRYQEEKDDTYFLVTEWYRRWVVYYREASSHCPRHAVKIERPELLDCLYELAVWCLEKGHIKTDSL